MIETVLGPVDPDLLGPTSMHEHVLSDARALADDENYLLDDARLAASELAAAARGGLRSVVDPTGWGFGGPAPGLAEVSARSAVQIVAGVGVYLGRTRPPWVRDASETAIYRTFMAALTERLSGCSFRAGVVGVIAPDHERGPGDDRLLSAAARAAADTTSALILRLDSRHEDGMELLGLLAAAGLPPDRVVLSNIDGYVQTPAHLRELGATGANLKWSFGYETPPRPGLRSATDAQRADALAQLWREGYRNQVLACGVWTRAALRANGGFGYGHLLASAVPALRRRGLTDADIETLLVRQPAALLNRP